MKLSGGAHGSVTLAAPVGFERITAVVVNADAKVSGSASGGRDWIYVNDNRRYEASLSR